MMWTRLERSWRLALVLVCGLAVAGPVPAWARGDKYFTKVKSQANVYVAPYSSDIESVAILPFKGPTELIGSSMADLFVTDILRMNRYTLVERSQMARVLSESELAMSGLSDSQAIEVGQMLGADGVIIGTVAEYGTVAYRGRAFPVVGVSARMIDCDSGEIVWSVDLAEQAQRKRVTLSEHARKVVHEMTAGLYQKMARQKVSRRPSTSARRGSHLEAAQPVGRTASVAPAMPTDVEVSDFGLREVAITWAAPPRARGSYRIERADDHDGPFEVVARVNPAKATYLDRGNKHTPLSDNTTYHYRLVAVSDDGLESEPTDVYESLTAPPPEPPSEITADPVSSRTVELSWEPSSSEGVVSYRVERARAGEEPLSFELLEETRRTAWVDGGTPASTLEDTTPYLYRVTSLNRVGSVGAPSAPVEVTTAPPPAAVTGLTAEGRNVRCVPVSWDPSEGEDVVKYRLYRSTEEDGTYEILMERRGRLKTSFLDGGRDPGDLDDDTTYFYLVTAENNMGAVSPDSEVVSCTTRARPPVVENVTAASAQAREVALSWEASPDEKVVGYAIYRAGEEDDELAQIAEVRGIDTTTYIDRGRKSKFRLGASRARPVGVLDDFATYRYSVRAFNTADVHSDDSVLAEATTKKRPETPEGLTLTQLRPHAIDLAWTSNPEPDIERYVVEYRSGSGRFRALTEVSGDENEWSDTGLPDGEVRVYRVKAVDADGLESDWSATGEGQAKPLPDPPEAVEAVYDEEGVALTWEAPSQGDVVEFNIYRKSFMKWESIGSSEGERYDLDPSEIGKGVVLAVTAVDEDGLESSRSAQVKVRPGPPATLLE